MRLSLIVILLTLPHLVTAKPLRKKKGRMRSEGRKVDSLPNGTACGHNLDCASGCCLINSHSAFPPIPHHAGSCVVEALPGQVCGLLTAPQGGRWGEWGIPGTYHRDYRKDFFPLTVWTLPRFDNRLPAPPINGGYPNGAYPNQGYQQGGIPNHGYQQGGIPNQGYASNGMNGYRQNGWPGRRVKRTCGAQCRQI